MAEIQAQSISNQAGTGPIDLEYQSAALVLLNWENSTPRFGTNKSFGVSSLIDNNNGNTDINYTSSLADSYPYVAGMDGTGTDRFMTYDHDNTAVSFFRAWTWDVSSSGVAGSAEATFILHGDLA